MTINSQPPDNYDIDKSSRSNVVIGILIAVILGLLTVGALLFIRDGGVDDALPGAAPTSTTTTTTVEPGETTTTAVGDTTTTTVADTTTTTVADTTTTTTTAAPGDEPTPAEQAALTASDAWIQAIVSGDSEAAWELLSDESRIGIGGRDGLDESLSALGENYSLWADDGQFLIKYTDALDDETVIVTYLSSVESDGGTVVSATAIPVQVGNSLEAKVTPFVGSEAITWVTPDPQFLPSILDDPDPTFRAIVPTRATSVTMFVNGEPAAEMEVTEIDSFTSEITGRSPRLLEVGGLYVVTVVYTVDVDGIIHAEALPFVILEDSQ